MTYDRNNIFARILRGEIPCKKVYEDEHVFAFDDITARAPTHVLVIPKGEYVSLDDLSANPSTAEISALVRSLVECYDFCIYGVLAVFFAQHFFPPGNPGLAFLASLAVFWFGFIMRPFGAVFFGYLGDRIGRKFTFMLTLALMGLATFLVGLLPTYASWGLAAPILLLIIRAVQGLALGGEDGGAATYIAEHSPDGERRLYTSWVHTTPTMGIVAALLVILLCRLSLGDAAFIDWGWRIPFLLSAVLVVLSAFLLPKLEECPLFPPLKHQEDVS